MRHRPDHRRPDPPAASAHARGSAGVGRATRRRFLTSAAGALLVLAAAVGAGHAVGAAARGTLEAASDSWTSGGVDGRARTIRGDAQDTAVPVLVELFTSEGCSSCPPADRVLIDLVTRQPVNGARVIALSEHVDYWDRLGWKDPFSDEQFTTRQSRYAARDGSDRIYTPQMVVDGGDGFVGSDRARAIAAVHRAAASAKLPLALAWIAADPPALRVTLAPEPGSPEAKRAAGADVLLALVQQGLSSDVAHGENAGLTLTHAGVTRRLRQIGRVGRDGTFRAEPRVTLDPAWGRDGLDVVVFVQPDGRREVLAVATVSVRPGAATGR